MSYEEALAAGFLDRANEAKQEAADSESDDEAFFKQIAGHMQESAANYAKVTGHDAPFKPLADKLVERYTTPKVENGRRRRRRKRGSQEN